MQTGGSMYDVFVFDGGLKLSKHSRSFLKIQDGCSQFCSFCIVPFARGLNRSIPPQVVLQSLRDLGSQGVDEVVLTGIHLGTYGKDLNPRTSFFDLLRLINFERPVKRVRLSSIDPEEISPDLIALLAGSDFFCPHLHLPLQSGDNAILKKMRRHYTGEYFIDLCQKILEKRSDFCLGTDVIVGFPTETEKAFKRTVQVLKDSGLSYLHVFPYSERLGTKAALFSYPVSLEEKKVRSRYLRQVSEKLRKQFYQKFIGFTRPAILENRRRGLTALTDNYISVEIKDLDQYVVGSLVNVTIEGLTGPIAYGRIVENQSHSAFYI